ncbi:hypothetical protein H0E87_030908 [Populus deltoides]|uniref:Uncharacterized protein n=1 Tax=Populus deltoides TaxID=3696 RepID=A0A8T2WIP6_POPDE|nr:hypothetical protein H0E87_030908 [Populus deltoides]
MEKEMNVQAHLSGQIFGQVQNQLQPQQNGNQQMQNLSAPTTGGVAAAGAHSVNVYNAEPELHRYRWFMQQKIFLIILQKQSQPVGDQQKQKFKEFAKRLEEGLFKAAQTKDDYLNMNTLESCLSSLLKRPFANSQNQRHPQLVNSSSSIGTMIPTPGNLLNGYQQSPANFSISSGGNMSSMGVQIMESQMIPSPGFSNNNNNNQSYMNVESSNISGGFSTADSAMVSQTQQPKQYIGGQNSRILVNFGSQMGSNIRTGLQQKSYGFANRALNGGMGMMGNNIPHTNEPGTSEDYMTSTHHVNSPKPLPQQFDQHQRQLMQGDGYGMSNADSLGSGNIYGAVTSVGSMMNAQSMSKTNSSLVNNQSNLHAPHQAGHIKLQSLDQSEKMNFQSSLQQQQLQQHPPQQQQLQQHPHQFQQQQLVQQQRLQK